MGYSAVMMPEPLTCPTARLLVAAIAGLFLSGNTLAADKPMVTTATDSASRMMVAEAALERGECRVAAEQ